MVHQLEDYFTNPKVIESFTKYRKEDNDVKTKLAYLSFELEAKVEGVQNYAIKFTKMNPLVFLSLVKTAKFGDNLSTEQIANIEKQELTSFTPTIVNDNEFVLPYTSGRRLYRLILDITSFDGKDGRPDYRTAWSKISLNILASLVQENILGDIAELPNMIFEIEISDCDFVIEELTGLIEQLGDDLPLDDLNFVKNIIGRCSCDTTSAEKCEFLGETLETFELPTFENESVLFELTNMDSLICYLKSQITKYKSEMSILSKNSANCYRFVPCLVKAYVGLNKLYRKSVAIHNTLLISARHLSERYAALAADHRRGIEAMKGIMNSNIEWIRNNLDSEFDISKVTCSSRVEINNGVAYSYKEKYSRHFNHETKRY